MHNPENSNTKGYIDTYYTRSLQVSLPTNSLVGDIEADVCIVGGGIAGVSAAWEFTNRGMKVVLLEANRISWGASGRNGGILSSGYAASADSIKARSGSEYARELYNLSKEGVEIVVENTRSLKLKGVNPTEGVLVTSRYPDADGMRAWQRQSLHEFGQDLEYLPRQDLRDLVKSDKFFDGLLDRNAYHIHPLNYCVGLALDVVRQGGQVFEHSAMTQMDLSGAEKRVQTENGTVKSKYVVLCGSGYSGSEFGKLRRSLLPIATYVVSTRDLGDRVHEIMNTSAAIADTRLSCDYFRMTPTGELLWGGGMSGLAKEPANLKRIMKARITDVFPQLSDVDIEVSWTGLMGYARHKMPYLVELQKNVWTMTALGGHGLNTGPALGRVLAEALCENGQRHKLFRPYGLRWNGSIAGPFVADGICAISNLKNGFREKLSSG